MREDRKQGARRLGDLIAELLKSPTLPGRGERAELLEAWGRAAGPEVARRSRPLVLRNGELTVGFESSALRHEVEAFRKAEILVRLGAEFRRRRIASIRCVLT